MGNYDISKYTAYFNGGWVPYSEVKIDPLDRGFFLGDSVFEVERTFNGKSFKMREHIERLYRSLSFARIDPKIDAEEMIKEIKGYKMLTGYRSFKPANMDKLKDLLLKVSDLAMQESEISEMDLNPVFAYENDVVAADARIILTDN